MKSRQKRNRPGFTLVELSFAIVFVSILLLTVALITSEIISIYRKGYAIKNVNRSGRELVEDLQNTIIQSSPVSTSTFCSSQYADDESNRNNCNDNNGLLSFYQQYYDDFIIDGETKTVPTGGVFCSGKYTYIWNTGYALNKDGAYKPADNQDTREKRLTISAPSYNKNDFYLVKVEDASRSVCMRTIGSSYPASGYIDIDTLAGARTITLNGKPEELLSKTDAPIVVYDFVLFEPARVAKTNRLLFSGSFILATLDGGVDIMTSSNYCQAPSYFSADFTYCAINKFNFTIQASGS